MDLTWDLFAGEGTYNFNNRFALVGVDAGWFSIGANLWKYEVNNDTYFTFDRDTGILSAARLQKRKNS